jgi:aromatic-L-amino-acid decarboxylase
MIGRTAESRLPAKPNEIIRFCRLMGIGNPPMPHPLLNPDGTLDPQDWPSFRAQGHRMLDDMFDYLETIRERPVWQPMPDAVRARFRGGLPMAPAELSAVHEEFLENVLPYSNGNVHPGFMGWVHGGGNAAGMLAEMLAAGLNANLGGRDHAPIEVERQIVQWMRQLFGFPATASGLFVTGTSMANLIAVLVARDGTLGNDARRSGVAAGQTRLTAYTSMAAHGSLRRAFDFCGLGSDALRLVPVDSQHQINLAALDHMIEADRNAGYSPFLIVGTAGTVDTGAIDDLDGLAVMASEQRMWLHVDGAWGALGILAPEIAPRLAGIEAADSLAFDFHKWGQVPYDAGFVLVRDGELHRKAFASPAAYLERETRGLAGGSPWPCDFGPDLSRGFRALKTWFTLKVYGLRALGQMIARTCELAAYLEQRIAESNELELLAPVPLNIVCFRYRSRNADRVNARIAIDLQESGISAPSTTRINGDLAIRAAITNHRTDRSDIDALVDAILAIGRALTAGIEDPELEAAYRE